MPCTVHLPFLFFIILSSVLLLSLSSFFLSSFFPCSFFLCSVLLLSPVAVKLFFPFFLSSFCQDIYIYIYIFVLDLINNTCIATMNVATSFFLSQ
jgi:hypothetical protein